MNNPNLTPSTGRLSDLAGNVFRDALGQLLCAKCSSPHLLEMWREHDHLDRPECRVVVLCRICAKRLVKPHPRLYYQMLPGEVVPGSMPVCATCAHQKKLGCDVGATIRVPDLKPSPGVAMIDGRNFHRSVVIAYEPITECAKKETYEG